MDMETLCEVSLCLSVKIELDLNLLITKVTQLVVAQLVKKEEQEQKEKEERKMRARERKVERREKRREQKRTEENRREEQKRREEKVKTDRQTDFLMAFQWTNWVEFGAWAQDLDLDLE